MTSAETRPESPTARQSMPMVSSGPCWICGSEARDRVWCSPFDLTHFPRFGANLAHADHAPIWLVRCRNCGFGQPETMPDLPDYFDNLYDIPWSEADMASDHTYGYKDFIFRGILAELERRLSRDMPRDLLDVGCHTGRFLSLAKEAGWHAEGVELAARTAAYAAERTGLTIHQMPAQELVDQGHVYSAVTITDVLEHIPRPAPIIAQLHNLLRVGGVLAVKVPHGPPQRHKERVRLHVLRKPDAGVMTRLVHINHFTVRSLRHCLQSAGFRDIRITIGAPEFSPPYSPSHSFKLALSAAFRRSVYRLGKVIPGGVHTPLSLNLQAYAIRTA